MKRAGELMPGIPDIAIIYQGRLIGIELKAAKGRLSPDQKAFHTRLRQSGADVEVIRSLPQLYDLLSRKMVLRFAVRD